MAFYVRAFTTTCPGALIDSINDNVNITPTLVQIISIGDGNSTFDFTATLSGAEETEFDNVLAVWVCPAETDPSPNPVDNQNFDDTEPPAEDVIWSSEQITNNFAPLTRTITGTKSVSGGGDLTADRTVELVNDQDAPGNYKMYATNGSGTKGWYDQPSGGGGGGDFDEFDFAESLPWSDTSSTSYQRKLRLTTSSLPAGLYRIGWSYRFHSSSTSYDYKGRVQLNDNIDLMIHRQEPQDSGTDQSLRAGGFAYYSLSGVNNIDIDFASSKSGKVAFIAEARLEIWRVDPSNTTYTPGDVPGNHGSGSSGGGDDD